MSAARQLRGLAVVALLAGLAWLSGCDRRAPAAPPPPPAEVQADAVGHYCGMLLVDHEGPKGQVHLSSRDKPVWFSSVRDTIAFLRLPEEPRDIAAVYVNDMGRATEWAQPGPGTWTDARQAWFVIESDMRGGMGAPEAVPFADRGAADAFQARHGGRVLRLADIPDAYVLGPVDLGSQPGATAPASAAAAPAAPGGHATGDGAGSPPSPGHGPGPGSTSK